MIMMPFGQHKGRAIGDARMHDSYLSWLIETTDARVTDEMREVAYLEQEWRKSPETAWRPDPEGSEYLVQLPVAYTGLDPQLHAEILWRVSA